MNRRITIVDSHNLKRSHIADRVNSSNLLRDSEKNISTNLIDNYRVKGIIPDGTYERTNSTGRYMYSEAAVGWAILGRKLERRSKVELLSIGKIITLITDKWGV